MEWEREGHLKEAYDAHTEEQRQEIYRRWAKTYDQELVDDWEYVAPQVTAALFQKHQPNTEIEILEVGVGTGLAGQALRDVGYATIDGVDAIQEMLDEASKKKIYRTLRLADIRKPLPFYSDSFDAMVSVGTYSINDIEPKDLLPPMATVKQGGLCCFTVNEMVFKERNYEGYFERLKADGVAEALEIAYGDYIKKTETRAYICVLKVL